MAHARVSCPGKVLVAGGYLVTQEGLPGLVLSTTARFHCTAAFVPPLASDASAPPAAAAVADVAIARALAAGDWAALAACAPPPACGGGSALPVDVASPQFHTQWGYTLAPAPQLRLAPVDAAHRNPYVEWAANTALLAAGAHLPGGRLAGVCAALAAHGYTLRLLLQADNDFYSQRAHLEARGLPVTTANLAALPRFNACPRDAATGRAVVHKTGLGSSAALVTAVCGALLSLLRVARLGWAGGGGGDAGGAESAQPPPPARVASQRLVHDVAQTAHCLAQGKVGSGFDVCSASYGSVRYVRVPPAALEGVMDAVRAALAPPAVVDGAPAAAVTAAAAECATAWAHAGAALRAVGDAEFAATALDALPAPLRAAVQAWRLDIAPFGLPASYSLLLGDVCGGSETPGMVRDVMKWKAAAEQREASGGGDGEAPAAALAPFAATRLLGDDARPRRAAAVAAAMAAAGGPLLWRRCAGANALLEEVLRELRAAADAAAAAAGEAGAAALERDAADAFALTRRLFRDMGAAAGVPLEPASQTALIDSLLASDPRVVLAAGVPGAGGFDAVFAVCRGQGASIDALFGGVAPPAVTPCLCSCGPAMGAPGAGLALEE